MHFDPSSVHFVDPSDYDVLRFYINMLGCDKNVIRKKWFWHFHPILAVASGQDLKDELTLGGELMLNVWRCMQHVLSAKEKRMYCGVACEMETDFDPRFVSYAGETMKWAGIA